MEQINVNVLGWTTNPNLQHHRRAYAYGQKYHLPIKTGRFYPFQLVRPRSAQGINRFELIREETGETINVLAAMQASGLRVIPGEQTDTISYLGTVGLTGQWAEGLYYAVMGDSQTVWYSDYFAMVNDVSNLVRVEWWHNTPIEYRDGVIDFAFNYKNYVYLKTDIGKPAYPVDQEVITKNGVEFPLRITTWKEYRFEAIVPEYLSDCLRLVRQHDNKRVHHLGRTFTCEMFRMESLDWQEQGDLGVAQFSFRTGTVVTTRSQPSAAPTAPQPSECLQVRYTVNRVLNISEFINNINSLGSFGIVGDHIAVFGILDLGSGPTGSFNVSQITHLSTTPNRVRVREAVAGDVLFDLHTETYAVHTGTSFGFGYPRVTDVSYTGTVATISGLGLTGAVAELMYRTEFGQFQSAGRFLTAAELNAGFTIEADGWTAVQLVFSTPTCGEVQTSPTFFINQDAGGVIPPNTLTGYDYDKFGSTVYK